MSSTRQKPGSPSKPSVPAPQDRVDVATRKAFLPRATCRSTSSRSPLQSPGKRLRDLDQFQRVFEQAKNELQRVYWVVVAYMCGCVRCLSVSESTLVVLIRSVTVDIKPCTVQCCTAVLSSKIRRLAVTKLSCRREYIFYSL